jgi:hypothetical protein
MEALQKSVEELVKFFGAMAADVKVVSGDVQGLRQQIVDFGEDLDGVKRRLVEPAKQTRVEIPQANKGATTARLVNNGPPLIDTSPHALRVMSPRPRHRPGRQRRKLLGQKEHMLRTMWCGHAATIFPASQVNHRISGLIYVSRISTCTKCLSITGSVLLFCTWTDMLLCGFSPTSVRIG